MEDNRFGFSFERFGKGHHEGRRPSFESIDSDVTVADTDVTVSDTDTDTEIAAPPTFDFDRGFHRPLFGRPPFDSDVTVADTDVTVSDTDTDTQIAPPAFGFDRGFDRGFHRPLFGRPPFDSDVTVADTDVTVSDTDTEIAAPERPDRMFFNEPDDEPWFAREDNFFRPCFDFKNDDLSSIINDKTMSASAEGFDEPDDFQRFGGKHNSFLTVNNRQFNHSHHGRD